MTARVGSIVALAPKENRLAFENVFFDLDGTLVDTTYLHTYAWWRALDEAGESVAMVDIQPLIGMGGDELLHALIGREDEAISKSHGRHFSSLHPWIRPLPGAVDLLNRIPEQGGRIVVVTSAKEADLPALLGPLGGEKNFADVVHGEMVEKAKPSPDLFHLALERAGVSADEALGFGDALWDITAARKAGVACVALESGGTDGRWLREAGAIAVYRSCAGVLAHWATSPLVTGRRWDADVIV